MQNIAAWVATVLQSNSDGSPRKAISAPIPTLGVKSMEVYLNIGEIDSDTQVIIKWSKSADAVKWYDVSTAVVDTGAGADAETKVYIGNNGSARHIYLGATGYVPSECLGTAGTVDCT